MATYATKMLEGTLSAGASFSWGRHDMTPPFDSTPLSDRQPSSIVTWQAVPIDYILESTIDPGSVGNPAPNTRPTPRTQGSSIPRPAINTDLVAVVQEQDSSLTHVVTIHCFDRANTGKDFIVTFVLYAVITDFS